MEDDRPTIFVVSTRRWYDVWVSGQTRHEHSPHFRHIPGSPGGVRGLRVRPGDRFIYGDTKNWSPSVREAVMREIAIAQMKGGWKP